MASQRAFHLLHADAHLLVLDKPSGLLAVPGRGPDKQDCLSARVQAQYPDALIIHRLDMDTSGLLIMARGLEMQRQLSMAFAARRVHKRYVAVVAGHLAPPDTPDGWGLIDLPLRLDWPNRPKSIVDHGQGKPSQTRWRVLEHSPPPQAGEGLGERVSVGAKRPQRPQTGEGSAAAREIIKLEPSPSNGGRKWGFAEHCSAPLEPAGHAGPAVDGQGGGGNTFPTTRVELEPITGRSHQIRVHLQALGHPILGDPLYAPPAVLTAADRLLLHASHLEFCHPGTGEVLRFHCPPEF